MNTSKQLRFDPNEPICELTDYFNVGMNRNWEPPFPMDNDLSSRYLHLAPGPKHIPWMEELQLPQWNGETDPMPFEDNIFDGILAIHFLEHLTLQGIINVLSESARVLKDHGVLSIVVPHRLSAMAYFDLTHKSFFTEETFKKLMFNDYYDTGGNFLGRKFDIHTTIIFGEEERTLALFTQLVRRLRSV